VVLGQANHLVGMHWATHANSACYPWWVGT